jgi:hypothetical protein
MIVQLVAKCADHARGSWRGQGGNRKSAATLYGSQTARIVDDAAVGQMDDDNCLTSAPLNAAHKAVVADPQLPITPQAAGIWDKPLPRVIQFRKIGEGVPNSSLFGRAKVGKVIDSGGVPLNLQDLVASKPLRWQPA